MLPNAVLIFLLSLSNSRSKNSHLFMTKWACDNTTKWWTVWINLYFYQVESTDRAVAKISKPEPLKDRPARKGYARWQDMSSNIKYPCFYGAKTPYFVAKLCLFFNLGQWGHLALVGRQGEDKKRALATTSWDNRFHVGPLVIRRYYNFDCLKKFTLRNQYAGFNCEETTLN